MPKISPFPFGWRSVACGMSSLQQGLFGSAKASGGMGDKVVGSLSSGYGHSAYGHSGYGHSDSGYGNDKSSGYGHSGGHGHSGGYGHSDHYGGHSGYGGYHEEDKCCPLVVDFLCLAAILGAVAGAALLLQRVIQIEIMAPGKRKRSLYSVGRKQTFVLEGKLYLIEEYGIVLLLNGATY